MEDLLKYHERSIVDLIIQYLKDSHSSAATFWNREKGVLENFKSIQKKIKINLYNALVYAYDTKYGNWENVNDLRKLYSTTWHLSLNEIIGNISNNDIIAIGSNNGQELKSIFGEDKMRQNDFLIVDISGKAIEHGRKLYNNNNRVRFKQAEINHLPLKKGKYDICISLRTVHSTGINTEKCVSKCYGITKPGGKIILSVSNGYVNSKGEKEPGMYNYETELVDKEKPRAIVSEIYEILNKKKAKQIEIIEGNAEIFITSFK